jgi:hypothetical protein
LLRGHDSELLVLVVDNAHFPRSDSLVHPYVFVDGVDLLKHRMGETVTITKHLIPFNRTTTVGFKRAYRGYDVLCTNLPIPFGKSACFRVVY